MLCLYYWSHVTSRSSKIEMYIYVKLFETFSPESTPLRSKSSSLFLSWVYCAYRNTKKYASWGEKRKKSNGWVARGQIQFHALWVTFKIWKVGAWVQVYFNCMDGWVRKKCIPPILFFDGKTLTKCDNFYSGMNWHTLHNFHGSYLPNQYVKYFSTFSIR